MDPQYFTKDFAVAQLRFSRVAYHDLNQRRSLRQRGVVIT
jgi:hypothetical protein